MHSRGYIFHIARGTSWGIALGLSLWSLIGALIWWANS